MNDRKKALSENDLRTLRKLKELSSKLKQRKIRISSYKLADSLLFVRLKVEKTYEPYHPCHVPVNDSLNRLVKQKLIKRKRDEIELIK